MMATPGIQIPVGTTPPVIIETGSNTTPPPPGGNDEPEEVYTSEDIQFMTEIKLEVRAFYYFMRFIIVGVVPWTLFLLHTFLTRRVGDFIRVEAASPGYYYGSSFLIGILVIWFIIAIHPKWLDDEDTYVYEKSDDKAKEKNKRFKKMSNSQFAGLMATVGMRQPKKDK